MDLVQVLVEQHGDRRCQMLTTDDIQGAVRLYGGTVRAPAGPVTCPLYAPIGPPGSLTARFRPDQVGIELSFTRPPEPALPAFLARLTAGSPGQARGGFAFLRRAGRCPTQAEVSEARRIHWSAGTGVGGRTTIFDAVPPPGRYCYAVWALDRANTPSATPATTLVTIR